MHCNVTELEGMVVDYIDEWENEIIITTQSGRRFKFYHNQNCCEEVRIWDTKGNLKTLWGKKLISVTQDAYDNLPKGVEYQPDESYTWTEITFKTTEDTVISRWIGESNGYYSQEVDFTELI